MELSLLHLFLFIPPLLLIEGFFSGSEIALLSSDRLKLKKRSDEGSTGARLALQLIRHPERILSTTLFMTNLCVIGTSTLITFFVIQKGWRYSELLSILITSPLIVILGELIPKTIFQRFADQLVPWVAAPIQWAYYLCYPATRVLTSYTGGISKLAGPVEDLLLGKRRTTRYEVQQAIDSVERETEMHVPEKRMIRRILQFRELEARHALIPLVQVDAIEREATVKQALERFRANRHSRMPVFSGRVDNIVGILDGADLLSVIDLNLPIRNFISSAHYAPLNQPLEALMLEMRAEENEVLIIVDEYGGAVGILTLEDIIEEIVGEINDEYDSSTPRWKEIGPQAWAVLGKTEILTLNEGLQIEIPEGEYETIAGFLLQQFGRIPEPGDELYFTTRTGTYRFTIRMATERAIEQLRIEKMPEPKTE